MGRRRRLLLRLARDRWWLFRAEGSDIHDAVLATCRMALARLEVTDGGYELATSRARFRLDVSRRGRVIELCFRGPWHAEKKGTLLRKLLAKQFEPVIPRVRIRLRRTR